MVLTVLFPALIVCQSRGELYKGEASTQSQSQGYLQSGVQYYQSFAPPQPYPQPQPQYYQQQIQSQSYPHPSQYYAPNTQYSGAQYQGAPPYSQPPIAQQPTLSYNQPAYIAPASHSSSLPSRTQSPQNRPIASQNRPIASQNRPQNNNNLQLQQNPNQNLDSRFATDEAVSQTPLAQDFTSRAPSGNKSARVPATTRVPPTLVGERFDDRGSSAFKKTLSFDSQLSDSMESFALTMMTDFIDSVEGANFMISPFSIYHMLVLIAEGAGGDTFKEIHDQLKFISLDKTRDFQQYLNVALK